MMSDQPSYLYPNSAVMSVGITENTSRNKILHPVPPEPPPLGSLGVRFTYIYLLEGFKLLGYFLEIKGFLRGHILPNGSFHNTVSPGLTT